ncbi:ThiF family adenylyltransferase [Planctomycetota bacterium]
MDFNRISQSIDVEKMQNSHVTIIGSPVRLFRDLVHTGLGAGTMVDFDRVSGSNPARQDFYSTDITRLKGETVAKDVQKINPEFEFEFYALDYCTIPREQHDQLFGHTDLFVFAADFFPANARGNLEALRLGKPALFIGLYAGGRAGEIIFVLPGETACYRCICGSRYDAFARGGASVSSAGGTISDLHLVDAIADQIGSGLITRGANNRFGQLIDKLGNRNLLQVKIDPDYRMAGKDIFAAYLGDHPANFSFTTIALPMEREIDCPDCSHLYTEETEAELCIE